MGDDGRPSPPPSGDRGSYAVPPQYPAPPDLYRPAYWGPYPDDPPGPTTGSGGGASRGAGPPVAPPEDPADGRWGPSPVAPDPDRWGPAPAARGGTALLDRPTVRRPVVAPPVRPVPPPRPSQSWEWEESHGLRNALLAAVAILLAASLIAAFIVFRNRGDEKASFSEPLPAIEADNVPVVPGAAGAGATTLPSIQPVTPPPVTAAPAPATTAAPAPATTAPPTTRTTPTTRRPVTTVTASPPITSFPPPTYAPTTTRTTTTRPTS